MTEDAVRALREALRVSPENGPLRQLLADTLLGLGRGEEAEQEYRAALAASPDDARLKLGLANAFYQQGKDSPALVLVESLVSAGQPSPRALVLYARLLLRGGERERAAMQYRRALEFDASIADADLAERLGIGSGAGPSTQPLTEDPSVVEGRVRAAWDEPSTVARPKASPNAPSVTFQDVGGMESLKEEIRLKIIHPLTHPELYQAYGKTVGGGMLMYGPPGCGKTHLARATAGEIKATFISVGINEVLDMWIGNSEKNLHEMFEQARRVRPCVLFFDEVDALGASRADMRHSGGRHLINQFLSEMDGMAASNEGVLILAATNAPWHVDPAFRRPGTIRSRAVRPAARRCRARVDPAHPGARQAGRRYRLCARRQEDRRVLGRRPEGRRRSGGRRQAPRGDARRRAEAADHPRLRLRGQ